MSVHAVLLFFRRAERLTLGSGALLMHGSGARLTLGCVELSPLRPGAPNLQNSVP